MSKPPPFKMSSNSSSHLNAFLSTFSSSINELPHLILLSKFGSLNPCLTPVVVANFRKSDNFVISVDSSFKSTPYILLLMISRLLSKLSKTYLSNCSSEYIESYNALCISNRISTDLFKKKKKKIFVNFY